MSEKLMRSLNTLLIILCMSLTCSVLLSCGYPGAWDLLRLQRELALWDHRIKLSIDNTASSEDLINFPVLVRLNTSRITYSRIKTDASDISFKSSDGMQSYPHEIEGSWNPSGENILWVKIPTLPAGKITDIWLYYSSETEIGNLDSTAVWDSTYNAVWHLGESGNTFYDSTSYGNTGTGGSTPLTAPSHIACKTGFGKSFASVTDSIGFSPSTTLNNPGPVTYSGWFYNSASGGNLLFSKKNILVKRNGPKVRFELLQAVTDLSFEENDGLLSTNVWVYLTISWNGISADTTGIKIYKNGNLYNGSGSEIAGSGTKLPDNSNDFYMGAYDNTVPGQSLIFNMDEFRISNSVRSADWIMTQYLSQNDQLITFGVEENL